MVVRLGHVICHAVQLSTRPHSNVPTQPHTGGGRESPEHMTFSPPVLSWPGPFLTCWPPASSWLPEVGCDNLFIIIIIMIVFVRAALGRGQPTHYKPINCITLHLCPISPLRLSLLRLGDSTVPGNSLWQSKWEFHPWQFRFCSGQTLWTPESEYGDRPYAASPWLARRGMPKPPEHLSFPVINRWHDDDDTWSSLLLVTYVFVPPQRHPGRLSSVFWRLGGSVLVSLGEPVANLHGSTVNPQTREPQTKNICLWI